MSELVPEVGDKFRNDIYECVVLHIYFKNVYYVSRRPNAKCWVFKSRGPKSFLKTYPTYIGKSKANINQLFEVDDGREFTGLYDKFGKKIMFGDVVHWTDGGDELSLEERIKTRWDRIAVVRKLYGAEVNFKVIDSPDKRVVEEEMDFNFGKFIYKDTKKYLTVVAENEKEYFDKFKNAGECMKWVLDREVQDDNR